MAQLFRQLSQVQYKWKQLLEYLQKQRPPQSPFQTCLTHLRQCIYICMHPQCKNTGSYCSLCQHPHSHFMQAQTSYAQFFELLQRITPQIVAQLGNQIVFINQLQDQFTSIRKQFQLLQYQMLTWIRNRANKAGVFKLGQISKLCEGVIMDRGSDMGVLRDLRDRLLCEFVQEFQEGQYGIRTKDDSLQNRVLRLQNYTISARKQFNQLLKPIMQSLENFKHLTPDKLSSSTPTSPPPTKSLLPILQSLKKQTYKSPPIPLCPIHTSMPAQYNCNNTNCQKYDRYFCIDCQHSSQHLINVRKMPSLVKSQVEKLYEGAQREENRIRWEMEKVVGSLECCRSVLGQLKDNIRSKQNNNIKNLPMLNTLITKTHQIYKLSSQPNNNTLSQIPQILTLQHTRQSSPLSQITKILHQLSQYKLPCYHNTNASSHTYTYQQSSIQTQIQQRTYKYNQINQHSRVQFQQLIDVCLGVKKRVGDMYREGRLVGVDVGDSVIYGKFDSKSGIEKIRVGGSMMQVNMNQSELLNMSRMSRQEEMRKSFVAFEKEMKDKIRGKSLQNWSIMKGPGKSRLKLSSSKPTQTLNASRISRLKHPLSLSLSQMAPISNLPLQSTLLPSSSSPSHKHTIQDITKIRKTYKELSAVHEQIQKIKQLYIEMYECVGRFEKNEQFYVREQEEYLESVKMCKYAYGMEILGVKAKSIKFRGESNRVVRFRNRVMQEIGRVLWASTSLLNLRLNVSIQDIQVLLNTRNQNNNIHIHTLSLTLSDHPQPTPIVRLLPLLQSLPQLQSLTLTLTRNKLKQRTIQHILTKIHQLKSSLVWLQINVSKNGVDNIVQVIQVRKLFERLFVGVEKKSIIV